MYHYLVLIWDPNNPNGRAQVTETQHALLRDPIRWQVAYVNNGVLVMTKETERPPFRTYSLADRQGVILGCLYHRTTTPSAERVSPGIAAAESHRIVASDGRHLVDRYWGSYLAVICDGKSGKARVLRDPTGSLTCYRTRLDHSHIFFSDMADLAEYTHTALSVSWPYIATRLLSGFHLSRECGVREIEDVVGGECITIALGGGSEHRSTLWHPGNFCMDNALEDPQRAAQEMRDAVIGVTHALAAEHSDILLRLSGGLDSSIVAGCLAQQATGPRVTCINFYIAADYGDETLAPLPPGMTRENQAKTRRTIGSADERVFARSVAAKWGFPLLEREKRASALNLHQIDRAPLVPRPSYFAFLIFEDEVERHCATETGATACFDGHAGDTVFYNTLRAIGALDYAYVHHFGPHLLRQVRATSILSRESFARVAYKVAKYGLLHAQLPTPYDRMKRPHLLTDDVAATVNSDQFQHPWINSAPRLCPGKGQHLIGMAHNLATYPHALHREQIAPSIHPLASQPVVETCLRIPTYVLLANGISRGLARRAFRDLLPSEIVKRTVKGAAMAFVQDRVKCNRRYIRERLLDGILVRQGVLDRHKLDTFLQQDQTFLTVTAQQIFDYLSCEAWLGQLPAPKTTKR